MFKKSDDRMKYYGYAYLLLLMVTFLVAIPFFIDVDPPMAGVAALVTMGLGIALVFRAVLDHKVLGPLTMIGVIGSTIWQLTIIGLAHFHGFRGSLASNVHDVYILVNVGWTMVSALAVMFLLNVAGDIISYMTMRFNKKRSN